MICPIPASEVIKTITVDTLSLWLGPQTPMDQITWLVLLIKLVKIMSLQKSRLITSKRDVIIIIINLAKYPDIIFIFPACG